MKKKACVLFFIIVLTMISSCQFKRTTIPIKTLTPPASVTKSLDLVSLPTTTLTSTLKKQPSISPTNILITNTPTPDTRAIPKYWREWPIIPTLSYRASFILKSGIEAGNDIHSFSRIGDCQGVPDVFLGIYGTDRYVLPAKYPELPDTIDFFAPSFKQSNVTAKDGFGVSSVLSNLFTNPDFCNGNETPLSCELRRNKPIVAFIVMGTNWQPNSSATFEQYLREIIDILIEQGTLPVIVTKADNIEGDWMLNLTMAMVAYDYDIPLVNAWRAVQYLPNHGLEENRIYMIPAAWDERNLATLLTLDVIRKEILQLIID